MGSFRRITSFFRMKRSLKLSGSPDKGAVDLK